MKIGHGSNSGIQEFRHLRYATCPFQVCSAIINGKLMKQFQKSANPAVARTLYSIIVVFIMLFLIPAWLQADTVAEEAAKIAAAAKAGELFARMAEEQKAAGDFWLCFRFAAAAGAGAEAAARLTRQMTDRIDALPADQQSHYASSTIQADIDSKSVRQAAESVQGYVMQGLGLITIFLLIFMAMVIWLIRRGAVGPFIKKPEEQR